MIVVLGLAVVVLGVVSLGLGFMLLEQQRSTTQRIAELVRWHDESSLNLTDQLVRLAVTRTPQEYAQVTMRASAASVAAARERQDRQDRDAFVRLVTSADMPSFGEDAPAFPEGL